MFTYLFTCWYLYVYVDMCINAALYYVNCVMLGAGARVPGERGLSLFYFVSFYSVYIILNTHELFYVKSSYLED